MTRCLTAAVLAAALLAVAGVALGYRRGREMAEPEDVLAADPYLAELVAEPLTDSLREHVAWRRWPSSDCPECIAAEAAGLR